MHEPAHPTNETHDEIPRQLWRISSQSLTDEQEQQDADYISPDVTHLGTADVAWVIPRTSYCTMIPSSQRKSRLLAFVRTWWWQDP